ncbi:2-dehydropantoate 2-reductase N-terminal domain-containing protein [Nocardioides sp.]|uniref:ketopantoate reductase family protein n=1 Tax=Nocardioides sp. TaxID=35761 RepID=UPI0031FEE8AD|nr:2-dehydropantoate 2-reductase [Nocardioides sp.]
MRYVVYGAGAVGGVIGARLHLAGSPTTFVARGPHLDRIRTAGLVLDTEEGRLIADAPATDTAAAIDWTDDTVVLLTVKSHQTWAALDDLAAHAPEGTAVVAAQNGVANEVAILRRFARTYGLCVMLPSTHLDPGVVVQKCHPTPGILDLGRYPGGTDEVTDLVAADLRAAGFESVPRPDIMAWKHRKLLVNTVGDVSALFGRGAAATAVAVRVEAEGEAVLAAAGIAVVSAAEDDERRGEVLRMREDVAGGNSLRQSLTRGLSSEIDYRAGEIVLLGRLHGVPTPANRLVLDTTHGLVRASAPRGTLDAASLLAVLGADPAPPNRK